MLRSRRNKIIAVAAAAAGIYWLIAYLTAPPTGPVETWPDRERGFIQFMASQARVGYLMISRLPEDELAISCESTSNLGVYSESITIRIPSGDSQEISLGCTPRVIKVGSDGAIDVESLSISRADLHRLEQLLEASVHEEGACQASSVALASEFVGALER